MSGTGGQATDQAAVERRRGGFSSRRVFILAAIGSAVGLGNIWRFPYVAYENGGGAFVVPYLVALLSAGIPFLLLDYAAPADFLPSPSPRGVGEHPHRGFETVTVVYQGEVEHRDSTGNKGRIGPGDVQWMTAASGTYALA